MRIVKVGALAPTNRGIPLGVQGENRATQVDFDTRPWFREYPSGTVFAVARRYGDPAPYPITLDVDDGTAVWNVSDTDTAKAGEGAVELTMTSAGTRVRSLTFKTLVTASLTDAPVDDDAWYGWLDKAVVKVDETVQSAQRKMAEVDDEWTGIKADVDEKVEECGKAAAQAADDAHHAKVDAQATAKALESAEGSVAKAEAAKGEAATSASNAASSASAAAKSASDAAASVGAINVIAPIVVKDAAVSSQLSEIAIGDNAHTTGGCSIAIGQSSESTIGSVAVGSGSKATGGTGTASMAIGDGSKAYLPFTCAVGTKAIANHRNSIACGANANTTMENEVSFGNGNMTREITHVSTPTAPTSASTKKYTDDNDVKTLTEAKRYTDANTSNALVGNVSGKLLHVEDAWFGKPLSLTIDGAYKQDGTPSPDNHVPVVVVENPVLRVTGADTSAGGASLTITLPTEHPYLAALPDGTHDGIAIDRYGNASLVASVQKVDVSDLPAPSVIGVLDNGLTRYRYWSVIDPPARNDSAIVAPAFKSVVDYEFPQQGMYVSNNSIIVGASANPTETIKAGGYIYTALAAPIIYQLGKLHIPSLPETISNVWTEAELTTKMRMAYKQDVNIVIAGLAAQIAALKGTDNIAHDESTASPDDAIDVTDNSVNAG